MAFVDTIIINSANPFLLQAGAGPDNHLQSGQTVQLSAVYYEPAIVAGALYYNFVASQPTFVWSSSNTAVATVSSSGLVTAVGQGFCTISASADGVTGTFNIGVNLVPATATCNDGQIITLSPNTLPSGWKVYEWGSGNGAAYVFGGTLDSIGRQIQNPTAQTATAITGGSENVSLPPATANVVVNVTIWDTETQRPIMLPATPQSLQNFAQQEFGIFLYNLCFNPGAIYAQTILAVSDVPGWTGP